QVPKGELRRPSEKHFCRTFKGALFYRPDHRRLATSLGQGSGSNLSTPQPEFGPSKPALFEQRTQLGSQQGRSTGDHDSVGSPFKRWHESHGPGNEAMPEETHDVQDHAGSSIRASEDHQSVFGESPHNAHQQADQN